MATSLVDSSQLAIRSSFRGEGEGGMEDQRTRGKIDTDIVEKIMKRYMDGKIPIDKFELFIDITTPTGYLFFLIDRWLDIALQNGVRDLVYINLGYHSSFNIFEMLTAKYLRELVLGNCNLVYFFSLPTSHVGNCHSLRKLSLTNVTLDDDMLQGLLSNYPLIENLIILYCHGRKKLEVRNLQKIRSLSITIGREQSVKIQAPTLEHLSYFSYSLEELDIAEYPNLKSLELSGCFAPRRINIGRSESLRVLKIKNVHIFYSQKIEVDAPNLVLLEYEVSHLYDKRFYWLMEFLANSTSWSQVSIQFYGCDKIDMEYLKQHYRVATLQVDVLDVILESRDDSPTLVDALLWCFHPRRLNISSSFKMIRYFMNRLLHMKNSIHSTSHGNKPQLSQLKEVKAYKFDRKNENSEAGS
uniref:F-box family protein n=1 Tax=Solanum tuberosum TaxID=4113 RepID=M1CJ57_SOLTU